MVVLAAAPALEAQVGHPPGSSPYRDLRVRNLLSLQAGYMGGSGGSAGVGPVDGYYGGARFDLHFGGPLAFSVGAGAARLDRLLLDPNEGPDARVIGTGQQTVVLADVGIDFYMTGGKTWRGFAPYVGAGLGLAFGSRVPEDSSQFEFGTRFQFAPHIGFRWHGGGRLSLRVEARDVIWRLRYPTVFFDEPPNAPGEPPILDRQTMGSAEWTHVPMVTFSIGYALRL